MITRENLIKVEGINREFQLSVEGNEDIINSGIFFDLEHYIYKKPICIGVFGGCIYEKETDRLKVTQYMIENKADAIDVLTLAKKYFIDMALNHNKRYLITFSGNNDFIVINYLFKKYNIDFSIDKYFIEIDIQKQFEKKSGFCVGLKALEKEFGIQRESELISGANLARTFSKIVNDEQYIERMPVEKKEKILLYNEQDVVSLFHMCMEWESVKGERSIAMNMFMKMRRGNKELEVIDAIPILTEGEYGVLSTVGENGYPYAVPLNYVFFNNSIYFHCAKKGNKLENINFNNKVSFCVVGDFKILEEKFTTEYESVIIFGNAEKVTGEEKVSSLKELIYKYSPKFIDEGITYIDKAVEKTEVIKINIESMTGKRNI